VFIGPENVIVRVRSVSESVPSRGMIDGGIGVDRIQVVRRAESRGIDIVGSRILDLGTGAEMNLPAFIVEIFVATAVVGEYLPVDHRGRCFGGKGDGQGKHDS